MNHLSTADQGWPIAKLRFHPRERLLASVAGPHAEVCIWGWDETGTLNRVASIKQVDAARVHDVAWHPRENVLALVGGGRAIELWSEGRLLKTLGKHPVHGRTREVSHFRPAAGGKLERHTDTKPVPVVKQGYDAVIFSASGTGLVASRFGEDPRGEDATEIYDVASGTLVDSIWRSDTTLALHPEGEILATISSQQLASAVRFGRLTDITFQGYDTQLNVNIDGYRRLVFSPRGHAFAVMGHSYGVGVRIYDFPSCRIIFELDFEEWEDVWNRLWTEYRGSERYTPEPDGGYPYEFISDLWTVNDRLAFHPDGRALLFGTMEGLIVSVDLEDVSEPSEIWAVHDGPVLALDVSGPHAVLATARCDGEIKLWRLDGAVLTLAPDSKPMTEAFLKVFKPFDRMVSEGRFRTTDGRRWYDFETIGEEELGEDAPPWAQIAKWMRKKDRPSL